MKRLACSFLACLLAWPIIVRAQSKPVGADQVLVRSWQTANLAGFPSALAAALASSAAPATNPSNANQVLTDVWNSSYNALQIYCLNCAATGGNVGGASSLVTAGAIPVVVSAGVLGQSLASDLNGTFAYAGGLQSSIGNLTLTAITNPTITSVTPQTASTYSYSYKIVALNSDATHTAASAAASTTTGATNLAVASHGNVLVWPAITGATGGINVYRTVAGGGTTTSTGLITATTLSGAATTYTDVGATGDSSSPPSTNTTGIITAPGFVGPLTGNVTGNATGSSGSVATVTSTGSANAQVISNNGNGTTTLTTGIVTPFIAGYTNSGATTINTVAAIVISASATLVALSGGEIQAGGQYLIEYNGTYAVLLNPSNILGNAATATTAGEVNGGTVPASAPVLGTNSSSQLVTAYVFIPPGSGTLTAASAYATVASCTSTCTFTPVTPVAPYGQQFCVHNADNVSTVITLAAVANLQYEETSRTSYGTADDTVTSGGAVGDQICMVAISATQYEVWSYNGTWTNN